MKFIFEFLYSLFIYMHCNFICGLSDVIIKTFNQSVSDAVCDKAVCHICYQWARKRLMKPINCHWQVEAGAVLNDCSRTSVKARVVLVKKDLIAPYGDYCNSLLLQCLFSLGYKNILYKTHVLTYVLHVDPVEGYSVCQWIVSNRDLMINWSVNMIWYPECVLDHFWDLISSFLIHSVLLTFHESVTPLVLKVFELSCL